MPPCRPSMEMEAASADSTPGATTMPSDVSEVHRLPRDMVPPMKGAVETSCMPKFTPVAVIVVRPVAGPFDTDPVPSERDTIFGASYVKTCVVVYRLLAPSCCATDKINAAVFPFFDAVPANERVFGVEAPSFAQKQQTVEIRLTSQNIFIKTVLGCNIKGKQVRYVVGSEAINISD